MRGGAARKCLLLVAAFLVAAAVARYQGRSLAAAGESPDPARLWGDGFYVSGSLFASVGFLSFIISWGGFDGLSYGATFLASRFTGKEDRYKSFFGYMQSKREERGERRKARDAAGRVAPRDFIITGLVMLALSFALLFAA